MLTVALATDRSVFGRFNKTLLSDQDLMELLVSDFADVKKYRCVVP